MIYFKKIILVVCFLLIPVCAFPVNFIVGAKSGYYRWEPYFKDFETAPLKDINKGDGLLYGPVLSVLFTDRFSLSMAVLTGMQSMHWYSGDKYDPDFDKYRSGNIFADMRRTDADTALSYSVIPNLKLFAGYKYQYIKTEFTAVQRLGDSGGGTYNESFVVMKTPAHGPALGAGYQHTFTEHFFVTANLSFLYMRGKFEYEGYTLAYSMPDLLYSGRSDHPGFSLKTEQRGINFEPSLGYHISEGGTVLTLGFRYQWLRTKFKDKKEGVTPDKWLNDRIYGVFLSVLLVF